MADTWYLIVRTPVPSIDVWPMGPDPAVDDVAGTALRDARMQAVRDLLEVPQYWSEMPGWDFVYSPGTPHPTVMAAATVHDSPPEVP